MKKCAVCHHPDGSDMVRGWFGVVRGRFGVRGWAADGSDMVRGRFGVVRGCVFEARFERICSFCSNSHIFIKILTNVIHLLDFHCF